MNDGRRSEEMRKKLLITILSMTMLLGGTLTVNAAAGMGKTARIAKYAKATVYSDVTGSYLGYATYGADCTKGTLTVTAQYFKNIEKGYKSAGVKFVDAGKSVTANTAKTGYKMWRVKVSGSSGRGIGWIKGQ